MWLIFKRYLVYPLNRIVKGVRKMLRNSVLLSLGIMIVPFGLVVAIEAINHDNGKSSLWPFLGIGGILISFIGLALLFVLLNDAKAKDRMKESKQEHRDKVLDDTLSELKVISRYLKVGEGKNGGSKDNPVKPKSSDS